MAKTPPKNNYEQLSKAPLGPDGQAENPLRPVATPFQSVDSIGPSQQKSVIQGQADKGQNNPVDFTGFSAEPKPRYDSEGDEELGDPKTYESAGSAGSGFVNLSHLLSLNKGSGAQSAKDFAKKVKAAGQSAQGAIAGAENAFVDQAGNQAGLANRDEIDVGGAGWQDQVNKQKNYKYGGPGSLMETSGYADLAKKVGSAQDLAKSSQSAYGVASEVSKNTGLSPTQSAASAFYMGVNNPNIKRAGAAFTNLQAALDKANSRSMIVAKGARDAEAGIRSQAEGWQKEIDDYNKSSEELARQAEVEKIKRAQSDAEQKRAQEAADKLNENPNSPDVDQKDDYTYAVWKGVPPEIARNGVDYDAWVAMGRPSWEEYKQNNK